MHRNLLSYNFCLFSLIFLSLWQNGSCKTAETNTMLKKQNRVATGNWGSRNVSMEVTDTGARLQFGCAHGDIPRPITLDGDGSFSVRGVFIPETPGPTREDVPPVNRPALYSGTVQDKTMTLNITLTDKDEKLGPFTLEQGKGGGMRRCR